MRSELLAAFADAGVEVTHTPFFKPAGALSVSVPSSAEAFAWGGAGAADGFTFEVFEAATPDMDGHDRLRAFTELPRALQDQAWDALLLEIWSDR